jgi:hypothetical protein
MSTPYKAVTAEQKVDSWGLSDDISPRFGTVINLVNKVNERLKERGIYPRLVVSEKIKGYAYDPYRGLK